MKERGTEGERGGREDGREGWRVRRIERGGREIMRERDGEGWKERGMEVEGNRGRYKRER